MLARTILMHVYRKYNSCGDSADANPGESTLIPYPEMFLIPFAIVAMVTAVLSSRGIPL